MAGKTTADFRLEAENGKTIVTLIHSGWDGEKDAEAIEMHTQGWQFFLQNLKSVIETGKDLRPEVLGMKAG